MLLLPTAAALLLLTPLAGLAEDSAGTTEHGDALERSGSAADQPLGGLPLRHALAVLRDQGLRIVFTDRVVPKKATVDAEPIGDTPRERLENLLSAHRLSVVELAGETLVVVAAEGEAVADRSVTGVVRSLETNEPLPGVTVRVVESGEQALTEGNGRFALADLASGVYTVEARLWGFVDALATDVVVTPGHRSDLSLAMQPAPFFHDKIVVRPSELTLLREDPAAPLALSRRDIAILPHLGGDIFRALSLLPGITSNDVSAAFQIHGGRRDEVLILLDGQELYEAFHLKDFDNALSIVPTQSLGSVSLSTGNFPASRGDRMGGVLDMTTTRSSDRPGTELSLSVLTATAMGNGVFAHERGHWLASGRRGTIDLARRLIGREDPSFWDVFAKVDFQLDARNSLRAHLLRAGDTLTFEEAVDGETKRFDTQYDTAYAWLTHQAAIGQRLVVESRVAASRVDRDRFGAEVEDEQAFEVTDRRELDVTEGSQTWLFQVSPRHALEWGGEVRSYEASFDYTNLLEPFLVLGTPLAPARRTLERFVGELDGEHVSAFVSDRFSATDRLTLELGLRYDRHTLTDDTLLSPRVNAAWRFSEASVLRAAWGHFHQSQRPYELQVEDGETSLFRAERSEHWVLGYERLFGETGSRRVEAVRIEVYRRDIRKPRRRYENLFEPINVFPEIEPDRVRITPERSRSEGLEIALRGDFGSQVDWWLNYAYASVEDRVGGSETHRQNDQPHTLNVDVNVRLSKRWNLNLAWRLRSGWTTTPVFATVEEDDEGEPVTVPALGALNSERLPTYHRLDLRATRTWPVRRGQLVFFVDIQNVYSRRNLAGFDLAIDEDTGELIVAEEKWAGFLPSLGISWSF